MNAVALLLFAGAAALMLSVRKRLIWAVVSVILAIIATLWALAWGWSLEELVIPLLALTVECLLILSWGGKGK